MSRALRVVHWLCLNAALIALTVAGTVYGVAFAWNLARFGIVFFLVVTIGANYQPETKKSLEAKGPSVPHWLSRLSDWTVILVLAATGHFVFAVLRFLQSVFYEMAFEPKKTEAAK